MLGHTIAVRKAPSGTLFAATTVPTIATSAATQISADNNLRTIPAESGRSSQCYCSQFAGSRRQAVQMYCSIVVDPRFTQFISLFFFSRSGSSQIGLVDESLAFRPCRRFYVPARRDHPELTRRMRTWHWRVTG